MSHTPQDQSVDPPSPEGPQSSDVSPKPTPSRRGRWWLRFAGVLLVIVVALVIFAPTIASFGPVRSIVLSKLNRELTGRVAVADWSLGWFSGLRASGIRVFDERNVLILDVPRITTGLSLVNALRGNFDLGDTTVDVANFIVRVDAGGATNFHRLTKAPKKQAPTTPEQGLLPELRGNITVNFQGTVESSGGPPLHVNPSSAKISISGINHPIQNELKLEVRVADARPGSISTSGRVKIAEGNRVQADRLSADQTIALEDLDLAAVSAFVPGLQLGGLGNGKLEIKLGDGGSGLSGEIVIDRFFVGGEMLGGDAFRSDRVSIPVQLARSTDGGVAVLNIERLGVEMQEASILARGHAPEHAFFNVMKGNKPDGVGSIHIVTNVDNIAAIANQLPRTLKLQQGVELTGGKLAQTSTIEIRRDLLNVSQSLDLSASGKSDGRLLRLSPIHLQAGLIVVPAGKSALELADLNLLLHSDFARVSAQAKTIAQVHVSSEFDLAKLSAELGQFVQMPQELRGNGRLTIVTRGDLTRQNQPVEADVKLNLYAAGESQKSLVDLDASARLNVATGTVPMFELRTLTSSDLRQLQQQFGALLPGLAEQKLRLESGQFYAHVAGSYDGTTLKLSKPLSISLPNLTVTKNGRSLLARETIRASVSGSCTLADAIAGSLSDLSLTTQSRMLTVSKSGDGLLEFTVAEDGALRGNGAIELSADLRRLIDLAQAWGWQVSDDQAQLRSGIFKGKVALAKADQTRMAVNFNGELSSLTVARAGSNILENENATIAVNVSVPDEIAERHPISATGRINSSFVNANISRFELLQIGAALERLQLAELTAEAPHLPKLWALAGALTPAAPSDAAGVPRPPLQITNGQATLAAKVWRDGSNTRIELRDAQVRQLALKRGDQAYAFDPTAPIVLKLSAELSIAKTQQIDRLIVSQMNGDLRVASFEMLKPITISNWASTPQAEGAIKATSRLEHLTPLLAVLSGSEEMPYSGRFTIAQSIRSRGDNIQITGETTAESFEVFDAPQRRKRLFSEKEVSIRNDVSINPRAEQAVIHLLSVDMPMSQAIAAKLTGSVQDWQRTRNLKDVKLDLSYDLARLWPVIQPLLAPQTQQQLKDMRIAGKYSRQFVAAGSFPAIDPATGTELPWYESIKSIDAHGELSVQLLEMGGLTIEELHIPVNLDKGQLAIVYAGKPREQRLPKPATCNGGALDIGGAVIDLTQQTPRLTLGRNQRLLRNVSINPLLGDTLGKYVNPIFANAQRARGLLDVTAVYCQQVALGEQLTSPESGKARIVFSLQEMEIANPLGSLMLGAIPFLAVGREADTFEGLIKDAVVTLDAGRTTQDITLLLIDPTAAQTASAGTARGAANMPLRFQGEINLATLSQSIDVSLPTQLLARFLRSDKDRQLLAQIFPEGVPISLKGTTIKPRVDAGNIGRRFIEGQLRGGLEGVLDNLTREREKKRDR